ncbi:MAG TPA: hypothetical protein VND90_11490 [Terracidiphilus sp.]|nr:hypothetical protein [Terracidiphilus sp.]
MPSPDPINTTRREYALTNGRKLHHILLAAVFLIGAGFFFKLAIDPIGRDFALVVGVISLVPGMMLVLQSLRCRLILDGDVIELHSAFRVHHATRNQIEGLRTIQNQYGRWTRVYLKNDQDSFNVSDSFTGEDDLKEWLKGLPDLDQQDADEITKGASSQDSPGLPDIDRSKTFSAAKGWAIGLSILAGVASVPVMFVDYAPVYRTALVLLLLCPPVGIILIHRFPLLFTVFKRKPDPRADLGFLIIWPGIGVIFSYQTSNDPSHLVDSFQLIYWMLLAFAGYVATLFQTAWKSPSRGSILFFIALTGGMYSIGLVNAANTLPDKSAPRLYQTWVLKMYESHSSKGTRYYLRVAPWGPIPYSDDVDVSSHTYDAVHVGDPVCFGMHSGFLRSPWYTLMPCPAQQIPAIEQTGQN